MSKWLRRTYIVLAVLLAAAAAMSVWTSVEKAKLNQRYDRAVERWESLNSEYEAEINRYKKFADQIQTVLEKKSLHP